jgi:DNA replication ATP-dependent helicase Dna2
LTTIIDPNKAVIFVDYKDYIEKSKPEFFNSISDSNVIESEIIAKIIRGMKFANFDLNNVAIITPYKAQENLLYTNLIEHDFYNVYTIDKSQGLEKEVVIISFVKNNIKTKLLKDIARINVAFTRPKSKLIIVGLIDCLNEIEKLKNYINVIKREDWCYKIDHI